MMSSVIWEKIHIYALEIRKLIFSTYQVIVLGMHLSNCPASIQQSAVEAACEAEGPACYDVMDVWQPLSLLILSSINCMFIHIC